MSGSQPRLSRRSRGLFTLWWRGLVLALLLAVMAGCGSLPQQLSDIVAPSADTPPPATPTSQHQQPAPTKTESSPAQMTITAQAGSQTNVLRIWLPPQFDPEAPTPAGAVLRDRLSQFASHYPGLRLEVRIKAENGPGGLLASLSAASVSAPLTLPDVVALPRPLIETAALKGVVYPMDGLPVAEVDGFLTEPDWYPYAVQMGRLQENTFGLPFASDLLVMASFAAPQPADQQSTETPQPTPTVEATPEVPGQVLPVGWAPLLANASVLAFPGADPQSLFTFYLYRSLGGQWLDADGRPYLDEILLAQVLAFYQQASQDGVLPYWLAQYETEEQTWAVLESGEAGYIVSWASHALSAASQTEQPLALEPLPHLGAQPYTLATGWVWAVASPDPEKRALAGELAAFLVESGFLAEWNAAAGFFPPRLSALAEWEPAAWRPMAAEIFSSAELLPPGDVLAVLGPPLRQATVDVLKQQVEPAEAARVAVTGLSSP